MGQGKPLDRDGSSRFATLDLVPVGACVLCEDGTVEFWNRWLSHWTGVPAEMVQGRKVGDVFPHLRNGVFRERVSQAFRADAPLAFPPEPHNRLFPSSATGGDGHFLRATFTPVFDAPPGEPRIVIAIEDTSEFADRTRDAERCKLLERDKSRLAERLRHTQRLESFSVVAGGIAHDFNNLLSVVMGNADIAAAEAGGQQLLSHCCGEIQKAAARATELVAQILAYSGGGEFVIDVVNLSKLVGGMQPLLEASVSRDTNLTFALDMRLPDVSGDATQLEQVVLNLVAGASGAIGENRGTIRVETGVVQADSTYLQSLFKEDALAPGEYVYLEVRDSGRVLDQGMLERMLDPARIGKLGDRGLGLAASYGVVRAHNGGVRVLSVPGEGTAVRIHFPSLQDAVWTDADEGRIGGLLDAKPGDRKILLADDEEMVRVLGEIILEQNGFSVLTARDGDEAVAAFEAHADSLSLVLLDMTMPKRDGYEVARAIRALRADIPIVLCSGYAGVDARSRFAGLQVDCFLQKPYHMSELLDTVQNVLARFY